MICDKEQDTISICENCGFNNDDDICLSCYCLNIMSIQNKCEWVF